MQLPATELLHLSAGLTRKVAQLVVWGAQTQSQKNEVQLTERLLTQTRWSIPVKHQPVTR